MLTFIIHRTLYGILLIFIASFVIFYGLRVAPGSITDVLTNPLNREALAPQLSSQLGLDKPLPVQYFVFAKHFLTGQLGVSMVSGQPISDLIGRAIWRTLILAAAAAFLTYAVAIPLGVLAAWKRNTIIDQGAMFFAVLGMGIPNFFLAVLLIHFFSVEHRWLPVAGYGDFKHLILPAVVLAAEAIAINLRVVRSSMLEELNKDYVRTLHAKGLSSARVVWVHVLRNALPPVIALAGVMLRTLLGYTLIVEVIFRWPGLGSQLVNSVLKRDYTLAQTLAILLTFAVIVFNILADVGQQWADPRTRTHGAGS
jgi:ABC-type dipeptide/oligopeptide/nickel transport system permease component